MAALLERIVRFCTLKPWLVVGLTLVLTLAAGVFSVPAGAWRKTPPLRAAGPNSARQRL